MCVWRLASWSWDPAAAKLTTERTCRSARRRADHITAPGENASCLATALQRGAAATRGTFIAWLVPRDGRVQFRAKVRAASNAAAAIGAAVGSLVLTHDTRETYLVAIMAIAGTFLLAGVAIWLCSLESAPGPRATSENVSRNGAEGRPAVASGVPALRNGPFLVITGLNGILLLHSSLLSVALPLWIAQRTDAPLWLVSVVVLVNTVGVVALQVRASRSVVDATSGAIAGRRSGVLLAATCVAIAGSALTSGPATVALLVAAAVTHLFAEILQAAAGWAFAFELAPESRVGEYQGVFNAGLDAGTMLAPALFAAVVASGQPLLWVVFAALFAAIGSSLVPVVRWSDHVLTKRTASHDALPGSATTVVDLSR